MRRESAIFSFSDVQTGAVSKILARSARTACPHTPPRREEAPFTARLPHSAERDARLDSPARRRRANVEHEDLAYELVLISVD